MWAVGYGLQGGARRLLGGLFELVEDLAHSLVGLGAADQGLVAVKVGHVGGLGALR